MASKKKVDERSRLMAGLAASLPDAGGVYRLSTASSDAERRRFLGSWAMAEHTVDGLPYVESFAATTLRGAVLLEPSYASVYDFRDSLCIKRVIIGGFLELEAGRAEYSYRMSVAISWELGPGLLLARPELGYQTTSIDGRPAAVKELGSSAGELRIGYRFEGDCLVLEEGLDFKRLSREEG